MPQQQWSMEESLCLLSIIEEGGDWIKSVGGNLVMADPANWNVVAEKIPNATDSHSGSTPKSEDSGSSGNSNGSVNGGNDDMSLDNSPEIPDIRGEGERSSGSNSSLPEKSLVELDVPSVTPSIECGLIRAGYKLQSSCPPPAVRPLDALREKRAREDSEEHECRMKLLRKQSELCNLEIELVRQKIEAHSKAEEKVSELHQLKRTVAEWKRKLLEHETAERTLRVRHAEEEHKLRIAALQPQPTGLQ
ncbi:hypothetical protein FOL47_006388 [Perkinsus chesapeaki]|uniref:Uncharacterized protein n=1 Tax=Perkinsus chesapeaki TaxID=330153 RepID=A0A7J6LSD9_PERCH|nr:hypothetical protein FOL47_006388 [Perkinsus chesapeaki]